MIVLGISGLPNAQADLRRRHPEIAREDERICQGLDSAACLVVDGRVVAAAAEERFSGEKGTGAMPWGAIGYCLGEAGVGERDVDAIAHGFNYDRYRRFFAPDRAYFDRVLSGTMVVDALVAAGWHGVAERFHPVDHHIAHAASAYLPSGFKSALCVVSDGMGEVESLSTYSANGGKIDKLSSQPIASSLGLLYSISTRFLGYTFNSDEYKVMGLSAYGYPARYAPFFDKLARFDATSGTIRIDWPRGALQNAEAGYPEALSFFDQLACARRPPDGDVREEHADFAAALQAKLDELVVDLVRFWLDRTRARSLCLAGGTFLNCKANESLCNLPMVERAFVQPAAGDDGTSLGAALHVSTKLGSPYVASKRVFDPFTGPRYTAGEVGAELERWSADRSDDPRGDHPPGRLEWKYVGLTDEYFAAAARDLAADRIIAWFHGRMEFGPRALGNRSILGLPGGQDIKERLNRLVKFREPFRPFAPAVITDDCDALFETRRLSPTDYMLCTATVRPHHRDAVGGVVHADGSARIQVVQRDLSETFWRLLLEVKRLTGIGCVVNTSFNVNGQPLIMSPATAVDTFMRTSLDRLYIEGFVACKTSK